MMVSTYWAFTMLRLSTFHILNHLFQSKRWVSIIVSHLRDESSEVERWAEWLSLGQRTVNPGILTPRSILSTRFQLTRALESTMFFKWSDFAPPPPKGPLESGIWRHLWQTQWGLTAIDTCSVEARDTAEHPTTHSPQQRVVNSSEVEKPSTPVRNDIAKLPNSLSPLYCCCVHGNSKQGTCTRNLSVW